MLRLLIYTLIIILIVYLVMKAIAFVLYFIKHPYQIWIVVRSWLAVIGIMTLIMFMLEPSFIIHTFKELFK